MVLAPMIHDLTIIGSVNICDEQTLNFPFGIVPDVNCLENSVFAGWKIRVVAMIPLLIANAVDVGSCFFCGYKFSLGKGSYAAEINCSLYFKISL